MLDIKSVVNYKSFLLFLADHANTPTANPAAVP